MSVKVNGGALEFDAIIRDSDFKAQINAMEQRLISLTRTTNQQADAVENYAQKVALAVGGYLSFATASGFLQEMVNVRGEFQKLEVSFQTMLKSKEKADQLMAQAVQLAAITPFTLQDVGAGAKQLLAYGFAQDKVISTLQMLGDVASGVGAPLNDIVYIYGTLQTQGRAYTRDIMQFTQRGIPIIDELAKQYGVTKDKVQELVEAGKVGFPQVEKAFQNLTGTGGLFFNLMEKQSKTLTGQISNLQDAWSRMLNDIGKQNEGALSSSIGFAIDAVNNYQKLIDILKVMVVAYGAYRTALIATTVAQQVNTVVQYESALAGRALTVVQALQSFAVKSLQMAWRALNATLLANPFTAIATVLATVTAALIVFSKETKSAKKSSELLAEAQKEITGNIETQKASIQTYIAILQNQNLSENERLVAYNKLKEIAPDIVKGLTLQQAATADLTTRTNEYITSLRQQLELQRLQSAYSEALKQKQLADENALKLKRQGKDKEKVSFSDRLRTFAEGSQIDFGLGINMAVNYAATEYQQAIAFKKQADKALTEIENQLKFSASASPRQILENDLKKLQQEQSLYSEGVKAGVKSDIEAYSEKEAKIQEVKKQLENLNKAETAPKNLVRNEAFLKAEIQRLTDLRAPFAVASKEYKFYTNEIKKLQDELNPKRGAAAAQSAENKSLNEQKAILEDIAQIKRDSDQSGLTKERTEIDKVNESYEALFKRIEEHNAKTSNSKYKITQDTITALKSAQETQVANITKKQNEAREQKEAEERTRAYEVELSRKAKLFTDYENAKRDIGQEKARELYGAQIGENETYMAFLQKEFEKYVDGTTKEAILKTASLAEAITENYNTQSEQDFARRKQEFIRVFEMTASFDQRRKQLERQYQKDVETIKKEFTGQDQVNRLAAAKGIYEGETNILKMEAVKQSQVYQNLARDLILYSKEELKKRIRELKKILSDGFLIDGLGNAVKLTPQMKSDIQNALNQARGLQSATGTFLGATVQQFGAISNYAQVAQMSFGQLSQSIGTLNQDLADTVSILGDVAGLVNGLATAGAGIAMGDPMAIIGGSIQAITSIVGIFAKTKESAIKAQKEIEDFQARVAQGELEINRIFRERERSQERLNKLRLQGLRDEKNVLIKQRDDLQQQYDKVLAQIQKESFVTGLTTQRRGGFLGIGRTTRTVEITQTLAGKTFDDLEKLYIQNQLTGKAKELFETLQKIKNEGKDINELLRQNEEEAKQIFTGTTTDTIIDSIINGFKEGKKSAADFADNFQELMQGAILNALKYQTLEKPLKEFYDNFSKLSQSGNTLTASEIEELRKQYNDIINNANASFQNLQQIAGTGFNSAFGGSGNSLAGAIRGMTEQQADLLAGQFGGLRITAMEQLIVSRQSIDKLTEISNNTSYIQLMYNLHRQWDLTGLKVK